MADTNGQPQVPLTPEQANEYEKPIRRELLIGLLVGLSVIIVLIVTVMEVRYRTALGDPRPSAALDSAMQQVVNNSRPLPAPVSVMRIRTNTDGNPSVYEVLLEDASGNVRYQMSRNASHVYLIDAGNRAGEPMKLEIELSNSSGTVSGLYLQDRGVPVSHYREVSTLMLREALAGFRQNVRFQQGFSVAEDGEPSPERIRRDWDAVMD